MTEASFLRAPLAARLEGLLDVGSARPVAGIPDGAAASAVRGALRGRPVVLAGTDPQRMSGAIGTEEAEVLSAALDQARPRGTPETVPCILLLDSGGAKLTEGIVALGAFRRLEAAVLDTVASGVPIAAVVGRNCFGGASMLAFAAGCRCYLPGSRLGLSGPRALDHGTAPAPAAEEVERLYGAEARLDADRHGVSVADSLHAVREALCAWVVAGAFRTEAPDAAHRRLGVLVGAGGGSPGPGLDAVSSAVRATLDAAFPEGWSAAAADGIFWGVGTDGRAPVAVAGFEPGVPVGAAACWRLAGLALELAREDHGARAVLVLDAPGQAGSRQEEALLPSAQVAHLAAAWHALRVGGRTVDLRITGEAGGAIYVALAAAASRVLAVRAARFQTLPRQAVEGVLGTRSSGDVSGGDAVGAGVIDGWLDDSRTPVFPT